MAAKSIFDGVFKIDGKLATRNFVPGNRVYDEELKRVDGVEYRLWNPYRSKLAAAISNGLKDMRIKTGSSVLYLGAATGTTPSHVSDIVGIDGSVYCVELSKRSMRDLLNVCEPRENMFPIFEDARNVEAYEADVGMADVIYQDVAAPDQDDILLRNASLLKSKGVAYVAIKSQSIDVSKNAEDVFDKLIANVSSKFRVLEKIRIEPYDKMHLFVVFEKKD